MAANPNDTKMVRDLLGGIAPQTLNDDGTYSVLANGDVSNVDFSKKKLLRDHLGGVLPQQYYDVEQRKFVPGSIGGSGASEEELAKISQKVDTEIGKVTQQLDETTQKTLPALKKLGKFSSLESSEIITYCNGTIKNTGRMSVSGATTQSVLLEKNDIANPGYFTVTPHKLPNDLNYNYFEFVFSSPNIELLETIEIRIVPDGNKTNEYYNRFLTNIIPYNQPPNTDLRIRTHKSELSVTNPAPSLGLKLSETGYIELRVTSKSGFKMRLVEGIKGVRVKSPVMIQFDDGHLSVYENAFPRMRELGMVGTFNVVATWTGQPGRCTLEQLRAMQNAGWSISNHSKNHADLQADLTPDEVVKDLEYAQKYLAENGFSGSRILAPPFNSFNDDLVNRTRHIIRSRKLGTRTSDPIIMKEGVINIQSRSVKLSDTPQSLIDEYLVAVSEGKYFSVCFHTIKKGDTWEYNYEPAKFLEFVNLLAQYDPYVINMETYVETNSLGSVEGKGFTSNSTTTSSDFKVLPINSFTAATSISDYPNGVSVFPINYNTAAGMPDNRAGIVITFKVGGNGYDRQEFKRYGTQESWTRYADQTTGAWSSWIKDSNSVGTTAERPVNVQGGFQYFDTDLNKPIWRNKFNSGWVDATGTVV